MIFNNDDFRRCMGHFTTGVTVVTTVKGSGNLCGMTVNSFTSLSLEPPLILFSIDKNAHSHDRFFGSSDFTVNILSQSQKNLSAYFANPSLVKWEDVDYSVNNNFIKIDDCLAYVFCEKETVYEGGDHSIIIGKVIDIETVPDKKPLTYYKGKYRKIGDML